MGMSDAGGPPTHHTTHSIQASLCVLMTCSSQAGRQVDEAWPRHTNCCAQVCFPSGTHHRRRRQQPPPAATTTTHADRTCGRQAKDEWIIILCCCAVLCCWSCCCCCRTRTDAIFRTSPKVPSTGCHPWAGLGSDGLGCCAHKVLRSCSAAIFASFGRGVGLEEVYYRTAGPDGKRPISFIDRWMDGARTVPANRLGPMPCPPKPNCPRPCARLVALACFAMVLLQVS